MACFYPKKAWFVGYKANGKKDMRITPYEVDHLERRSGDFYWVHEREASAYAKAVIRAFEVVPCGKCSGCRVDYSRRWADRCLMELQDANTACFITLTYDEIHVPRSHYPDPVTGEMQTALSLRKCDFQLFMKRLRKKYGEGIRFFACGEYGGRTLRPHYHAIIYNWFPDDAVVFSVSKLGDTYFTSDTLSKLWPFGHSLVGNVTHASCAYVARYVTKKLGGDLAEIAYNSKGLERPFCLMSRKPGIGKYYLERNIEKLVQFDEFNIATPDGGKQIKPQRYFNEYIKSMYPEIHEEKKAIRKANANAKIEQKLAKTNLSYLEMLEVEDFNFKQRTKKLKRDTV